MTIRSETRSPGTLGVVVPVYNEGVMIGDSLRRLLDAIDGSCWAIDCEVVVVDDGSTDATADVLKNFEERGVVVLRQQNSGRLVARLAGIRKTNAEFVLLVDSRVHVDESSLEFVCGRMIDDPEAKVWNAHAETVVEGNWIARFWRAITRIVWRRYFDNPRTTSYGLDEFDFFPKGTTCFLAPKALLMEAYAEFRTSYRDLRDANDDTSLIRYIAGKTRIHISPEFSCRYHSRDSVAKFLKHSYHRGLVFVDGYLHRGTRWFAPLVAFYVLTPFAAGAVMRWPLLLLAIPGGVIGVGVSAAALGAAPRDALVLAVLATPFSVFYGSGVWAGLAKRLRGSIGRDPSN